MERYEFVTKKKGFKSFIENISLTNKLIIVNTFLFILFTLLIDLKVIGLNFVALNPYNFLHGKDIWTILTSMFMHANFLHLFVNMLTLFFIGVLIEKIIGRKRYLWFYLISGLFSGLLFVLSGFISPSSMASYAVGASGALFGLIGLLIILTPNLPVYIMFIPIPVKMKYAGPGMLVLLWLMSISFGLPIGNFAHIGGLIAGLIYGFYLKNKFPNKIKYISRQFS